MDKKWANNKWKNKRSQQKPIKKKKFKVEYFHSFNNRPLYKIVNAETPQEAITKFQLAVKWDFDRIGKIMPV